MCVNYRILYTIYATHTVTNVDSGTPEHVHTYIFYTCVYCYINIVM